MTIFDDYLFLKSYKGVPLIFFSSKFRSPKLKKNHRFFRGGGFQRTKLEKSDFGLNQGGLFRLIFTVLKIFVVLHVEVEYFHRNIMMQPEYLCNSPQT